MNCRRFLDICVAIGFALIFLVAAVSQTVRVASAQEGSGWKKYPGPVLNLGSSGSWDDNMASYPTVIKDGSTYKMWYSGYDGSIRIGYATSPDGITWTKYGANPVLNVGAGGSWDDAYVIDPCVIKDGAYYKMWYTGSDGTYQRIGYAYSTTGTSWTKSGLNPRLSAGPSGQYDDVHVAWPSVIKDGSVYKMWYSGYDGSRWRIFYATSPDGAVWSKYDGDPVPGGATDIILNVGSAGSWDDEHVLWPTVLKTGDVYFMWYVGYDGANYRIGLAYSANGISWTKSGSNPVLSLGLSGSWDDNEVITPAVIQDGLYFKMWYSGNDGSAAYRTGYAENYMRMAGAMGIIEAPTKSVYYIYPDYQGTKLAGTLYAKLTDWTGMGMLLGMSAYEQYITTDTDINVLSSTGSIKVAGSYAVVLLGGPVVHATVKNYEVTNALTPVYYQHVGTTYGFYSRKTGLAIPGGSLTYAELVSGIHDRFVIEVMVHPESGRHVIIIYGIEWKGTYAGALWFRWGSTGGAPFSPRYIPYRDNAYYIGAWSDADGDNFVDLNEITIVASGS